MYRKHVLFDFPYLPFITQEYCQRESSLYVTTFFFSCFHVDDRLNKCCPIWIPQFIVLLVKLEGLKKKRDGASLHKMYLRREKYNYRIPRTLFKINTENDVSANKSPKWSWKECKFATIFSLSSSWLFNYANIFFLFKTKSLILIIPFNRTETCLALIIVIKRSLNVCLCLFIAQRILWNFQNVNEPEKSFSWL